MKAYVNNYAKHARRVNRILILLKKQGEHNKAIACNFIRNLWLCEARCPAI